MTTSAVTHEQVSLYYKEGSSDKEYHVQLVEVSEGWLVNFQYGRCGSALTPGAKTKTPVDYALAKKTYDKVVSTQLNKGYSHKVGGKVFQSLPAGKTHSGLVAQLSNPINEQDAEKLINDPAWMAQEKYDGRRRMLRRTDSLVEGTNRDGILVAITEEIERAVQDLMLTTVTLDSEDMGGYVMVFDMLEHDGRDLRSVGAHERWTLLSNVLTAQATSTRLVATALTTAEKRALYDAVKAGKREGLVFKLKDAPYTPGRPASNGSHRKLKFYEQATCRVRSQHKTKSSVGLELKDASGVWTDVGNVTVTGALPPVGSLIEARYLYAYPGGSLYQTSYCGLRDDVGEDACVTSQLKYKAGPDDEE